MAAALAIAPGTVETAPLSHKERGLLLSLESQIKTGLDSYGAAGLALREIQRKQLYRVTEDGTPRTFEAYCKERWKFSRSYAYRLIAAANVLENLSPRGDIPQTPMQTRPLAKLPPEMQGEVWDQAQASGDTSSANIEELTEQALAALSPEEQLEVVEEAEHTAVRQGAQNREAEDEEKMLAQAQKLFAKLRKILQKLKRRKALTRLNKAEQAL